MSSLLYVLALGNGLLEFFIFAAVYVVGFLLVSAFLHGDRKRAERRIARLAAGLNGAPVAGRGFDLPSIGFKLRGLSASMTFTPGARAKTVMEIQVPSHTKGRLTVEAVGMGHVLGQDYQGVGDRSFDASFVVRSAPHAFASRLFSAERRIRLVQAIRRLSPLMGLRLTLVPGWLEITVSEELRDWPQVLEMKLAAEEIVDLLLSLPVPGIELGERVECASGLCPICATPLLEPIVRCNRCSSPHHQDCWEYLGSCATYGCEPGAGRNAA